jgi:hypothetical protein
MTVIIIKVNDRYRNVSLQIYTCTCFTHTQKEMAGITKDDCLKLLVDAIQSNCYVLDSFMVILQDAHRAYPYDGYVGIHLFKDLESS